MLGEKMGELLMQTGLLTPAQLQQALQTSDKSQRNLCLTLLNLKFIKKEDVFKILESYYKVPGVDLEIFPIDKNVLQLFSKKVCVKYQVFPLSRSQDTVIVAFTDPSNIGQKDDLSFITRLKIQPVVAPEYMIHKAINAYYQKDEETNTNDSYIRKLQLEQDFIQQQTPSSSPKLYEDEILEKDKDSAPVIQFVSQLLKDAIQKKASDIHIEPYQKRTRIRMRIDGTLTESSFLSSEVAPAVISRVKIMAKMDIAEKRLPQDGRIRVLDDRGKYVDFRVSSLPILFGEKIVLRILDKSGFQLDLEDLGFEPKDLKLLQAVMRNPQGMILLTGPTGSGKTTTIYSCLNTLNQPNINISTVEDPVELYLNGINQVQVNSDIDLTFSNTLRSFLRQDPDIIMVGEIRDRETAQIAFRAASTGHLVISSLHTNRAAATLVWLQDMGVQPYIIASTVSLIIAQRLIGKNCPHCAQPVEVAPQILSNLGIPAKELPQYELMEGKGCSECNQTGTLGRIAIYEIMEITPPIRNLILKGESESKIQETALQTGMSTLKNNALLKLKRKQVSIEEVIEIARIYSS